MNDANTQVEQRCELVKHRRWLRCPCRLCCPLAALQAREHMRRHYAYNFQSRFEMDVQYHAS